MLRPAGAGDLTRSIYLRDGSSGTKPKDELGGYNAVKLGIVTKVDDLGQIVDQVDGHPQPRNWHVTTDGKLEGSEALEDVRIGVALIADTQNTFGSSSATTSAKDKADPFGNDWDAKNRSTRIVDYRSPRGRVGLLPQLLKVTDVAAGYVAATVLGPTVKADDGSKVSAGFVYTDSASGNGGTASGSTPAVAAWSTLLTINAADQKGVGVDGTVEAYLSIRTDGRFDDLNGRRGPLPFVTTAYPTFDTVTTPKKFPVDFYFNPATKAWRGAVTIDSGGGSSTSSPGLWGDASDGNVTLPASGTASFLPDFNGGGATAHGIQYVSNDGTTWYYKLKRDCFFDTLTLNANVVLLVSENLIPWGLTLAGPGRISSSALDWAGGAGGAGYTQGGADGAPSGGGSAGNGFNGYTIDFTTATKAAGNGGTASVGHVGGTGGTDQPHIAAARVHAFPLSFLGVGLSPGYGVEPNLYSSSGGGGGYDQNGGGNSGAGAPGGGAARACIANFKDTSGFTGKFSADGSPGGKGADYVNFGTPKCGGGGGASGGIVFVNTATPAGICTWTTSAKGGTGGAGVNGAANGTNGTDGVVMISRPA